MGLAGSPNIYQYAAANTNRYIDPDGLQLRLPPPAWLPARDGCTAIGSWVHLPDTMSEAYVRTRGTWEQVGRGTPVYKPLVQGAGLARRFVRALTPGTAPLPTGECWCVWKRRPGVFEIWRRSMFWKRLVDCGNCKDEFEFYLDDYEYERPGSVMHAPGTFSTKRTKGIWNDAVGCVGCPGP